MTKIIFCTILILLTAFQCTAFAADVPKISVTGEGIVEAPPDCATISVGVVSRNIDATKVQSENSRLAANIINSIAALGIDKKNIRTGNYNFRQTYRSEDNNRRIFDGYEVSNSVTILVTDLSKVGKVIDTALANGANQVDSLNFGIRDREKFQNDALRLAVRDALKKAEIVAAELGKSIAGVNNISINHSSISAPVVERMSMANMDAKISTPIETGTLNCSASVFVEFIMN